MSVPVILTIALTLFPLVSCSPRGEADAITFGAIPSGSAALVYIAQEQKFFAANGISVEVKDYATGVATIDALLKNEVDIAWAAEFPLIRRAFAQESISIIATSSRFSDQVLYCLKNRGIERVSDLKGKTIGVPRNTIAEFYLARFLELNGMNVKDVSLVDVLPPQSMDAITNGSVDGVVTWEPYSTQIKAQLAGSVVAWPAQSSQPGFGVIICRNDWIRTHPEIINRFLKSLTRAESYLIRNPESSKDIVQKKVNYDDTLMDIIWPTSQFSLSLHQSLITAMEDEARWMIHNNLTTEKQVPDFLKYIHEGNLKAIKPEAVNIIR